MRFENGSKEENKILPIMMSKRNPIKMNAVQNWFCKLNLSRHSPRQDFVLAAMASKILLCAFDPFSNLFVNVLNFVHLLIFHHTPTPTQNRTNNTQPWFPGKQDLLRLKSLLLLLLLVRGRGGGGGGAQRGRGGAALGRWGVVFGEEFLVGRWGFGGFGGRRQVVAMRSGGDVGWWRGHGEE